MSAIPYRLENIDFDKDGDIKTVVSTHESRSALEEVINNFAQQADHMYRSGTYAILTMKDDYSQLMLYSSKRDANGDPTMLLHWCEQGEQLLSWGSVCLIPDEAYGYYNQRVEHSKQKVTDLAPVLSLINLKLPRDVTYTFSRKPKSAKP